MSSEEWDERGRPDDWNPKVKRALELVRDIYEYAPTGGPLHVILDDWNIEDGDVALAAKDLRDGYFRLGPGGVEVAYDPYDSTFMDEDEIRQVRDAVAELVPLLAEMTVNERASALARHWGYLPTATEA